MVTKKSEAAGQIPRRRGRPPAINTAEVLDRAMYLLWAQGVSRLSLNELSAQLAVPKPVLARAFGNKEGLIAAALEHYDAQLSPRITALLDAPGDVEDVCQRYLEFFAHAHTRPDFPSGCFLASATSDCAAVDRGLVRDVIDRLNEAGFEKLTQRLSSLGQGQARDLARFLSGQVLAMSALARSGATRDELGRFVRIGLQGVQQYARPA